MFASEEKCKLLKEKIFKCYWIDECLEVPQYLQICQIMCKLSIYEKEVDLLCSVYLPDCLHCYIGNTTAAENICMSWILWKPTLSHSAPKICGFFKVCKIMIALFKKERTQKNSLPRQFAKSL